MSGKFVTKFCLGNYTALASHWAEASAMTSTKWELLFAARAMQCHTRIFSFCLEQIEFKKI